MARPSKYSVELKSRAVRMVTESRSDYPSEFEAIRSIAMKLGIGSPETLRKWIRQGEIDDGVKPGKTREDIAEIRELKKEVAELRRANSILKSASLFLEKPDQVSGLKHPFAVASVQHAPRRSTTHRQPPGGALNRLTHRPSVCSFKPSSRATRATGRPVSTTSFTASSLYSGENSRR